MDCYLITPCEHGLERLRELIDKEVAVLSAKVISGHRRFAEGRCEWATPALYIVDSDERDPQKWQVLLYQADRRRVLDLGYPPDDPHIVRPPYPHPFFYSLEWRDKRAGTPRGIELATAVIKGLRPLEMRIAPEPDQLHDVGQFLRILSGEGAPHA